MNYASFPKHPLHGKWSLAWTPSWTPTRRTPKIGLDTLSYGLLPPYRVTVTKMLQTFSDKVCKDIAYLEFDNGFEATWEVVGPLELSNDGLGVPIQVDVTYTRAHLLASKSGMPPPPTMETWLGRSWTAHIRARSTVVVLGRDSRIDKSPEHQIVMFKRCIDIEDTHDIDDTDEYQYIGYEADEDVDGDDDF